MMDFVESNEEIFVTVRADEPEVVVRQFSHRKILWVSVTRFAVGIFFLVVERINRFASEYGPDVFHFGYYYGIVTILGAAFCFNAGIRRTPPALMAAQLFGVCFLGLDVVAIFLMTFSVSLNADVWSGEIDGLEKLHAALIVLQFLAALVDVVLGVWTILICKKALETYLGSYEAKEEVHRQFHRVHDHTCQPDHDHKDHKYLDEDSILDVDRKESKWRRSILKDPTWKDDDDDLVTSPPAKGDDESEEKRGKKRKEENGGKLKKESLGSSVFSSSGNVNIQERSTSPAIFIKTVVDEDVEDDDDDDEDDGGKNVPQSTDEWRGNSLGKSRYFSTSSLLSPEAEFEGDVTRKAASAEEGAPTAASAAARMTEQEAKKKKRRRQTRDATRFWGDFFGASEEGLLTSFPTRVHFKKTSLVDHLRQSSLPRVRSSSRRMSLAGLKEMRRRHAATTAAAAAVAVI